MRTVKLDDAAEKAPVERSVEMDGRQLQATRTTITWVIFTALCLLFLIYTHVARDPDAAVPAPLIPPVLLTADVILMLQMGLRRAGLLLVIRPEIRVIALTMAAQSGGLALVGLLVWDGFGGPLNPLLTGRGTATSNTLLIGGAMFALAGLMVLSPWWTSPSDGIGSAIAHSDPEATGGTIICCSGGGIRSAAFCLGGLQRLRELDILGRARALIGVSGGGYIAGAVTTINHPANTTAERPAKPPFAPDTDEVALLRTQTNYLAPNGAIRYDLVVSWLLGAAVNVLLLYCVLQVTAALIAWQAVVARTAVIAPGSIAQHVAARWSFHPVSWQANLWWWLPAISIVLFMIGRWFHATPDRFPGRLWALAIRPIPTPVKVYWSGTQLTLVVAGLVGSLLVAGVPDLSITLHQAALHNQPTAYIAYLLHHLGYASSADCLSALAAGAHMACGATRSGSGPHLLTTDPLVPAVSLIAALTALLTLSRSALKDWQDLEAATGLSAPFKVLLAKFRRYGAPTMALLLLAVLVLGVLIRWTTQYLQAPAEIGEWGSWRLPALLRNPALPLLIIVFACIGGATTMSLFPFYRDRLARAFLMTRDDNGPQIRDRADWPPMSALGAVTEGDSGQWQMPELVLCTTANIQNPGLLPVGRDGALFIFSGQRIGLSEPNLPGSEDNRLLPADQYERAAIHTVADAVAISGGAIAPIAGRESRTFAPFRLLMALANVRTGAWVPNPYWVAGEEGLQQSGLLLRYQRLVTTLNRLLNRANTYSVVAEAAGIPSLYRPWLYLTDGGQYDNLGLVEALRRRPQRVIVLDASVSRHTPFASAGAAIATARMDRIAEIKDFDPSALKPDGDGYSKQGWVKATATYINAGGQAEIILIKSVLTRGQSWDIEAYKARHPEFPLTPTTKQLYDEFDFEAYRQLGYSLAGQCSALLENTRVPAAESAPGLGGGQSGT